MKYPFIPMNTIAKKDLTNLCNTKNQLFHSCIIIQKNYKNLICDVNYFHLLIIVIEI